MADPAPIVGALAAFPGGVAVLRARRRRRGGIVKATLIGAAAYPVGVAVLRARRLRRG